MTSTTAIDRLLASYGIAPMRFTTPTPDAPSAAAAVGCPVEQIAKSVLLMVGGEPVLVVTSGDHKVNSSLLKQYLGRSGKVVTPDPDTVRASTGYPPGGVSPFLLPEGLRVLFDASLYRFDICYPAAGDAASAVPVAPVLLRDLSNGEDAAVCVPLSLPL